MRANVQMVSNMPSLTCPTVKNRTPNFGCADKIASWSGSCPGNNESAGKRKSGKARKGNDWLRRILRECAHAAPGVSSKAKYEAIAARRGSKKAIMSN